jgi:protein TonB
MFRTKNTKGTKKGTVNFYLPCGLGVLCAKSLFMFCCVTQVSYAQGELLKQVHDSNRSAAQLNQQREARFSQERDVQAARLRETLAQVRRDEARVAAARKRWETARASIAPLEQQLKNAARDLETLYDAARGAAVDLHDTAERSLVTAQFPQRKEALTALAGASLPGAQELEALWRALQLEMDQSSAVTRFEAQVVTGGGTENREVTRIGVFTAFAGGSFYTLDSTGARLLSMARQPERRFVRLSRVFEAQVDGMALMVLDPTRGPLLIANANQPGLFERLWSSGVGGYFIAGIMALALLLILLQSTWLRSRLILDEQSIGLTVAVLTAFAVIQWWLWAPREPAAQDEIVAIVDLVTEEEEQAPDEPPPPEVTPPPPPPDVPVSSAETALAGLPALAAPNAAPLLSNINMPVKITGGGSLAGAGFGGFARGTGQGAGAAGFGRGAGFKGKELIPLSTARPQMPDWACKQNIKGWVEAVFTVLPNGRVQDVKIVDAQPRGVYELAAIASISNWIYAETDRAREVKQRVPMDPADCAYNWQ